VEYAADLLTWTECNCLPDGLRGPYTNNVYITMLFNDEVHTYEQVGTRSKHQCWTERLTLCVFILSE